MLATESNDAAVQVVDLGRPSRLDVLQHRRLVVVGDVLLGGVVDAAEERALWARYGL